MFRNYFKTALRNLMRYKGFALINIIGLSLGIVGCLVIGLFVWDEWQFDKSIPDGKNIYRVYEERKDNNVTTFAAVTPPMFATFLKAQYPEVEATTRIMMLSDKFLMEAGEKENYEDKGWFVDSNFFQIFPLKFLKGNPATALSAPASIVLTEELAKRYFGNADPIGKTIKIDKSDLAVTGILAPLPSHFHLNFHYLMPVRAVGVDPKRMENWTWHQFYTYAKLKPRSDVEGLQNKFQAHIKKEIFPTLEQVGSTFLPLFQKLENIHLQSSDFVYDNAVRGNETYVRALTIIALFVLVIACFNFINLATARSFRRAKEIGVRKVIGADRKQLVIQFLLETILLSLFSMVLAAVATYFILPTLNAFTGKSIYFNPFLDVKLALLIIGAGILIGLLAGIYPAMVLSGFRPIMVLKSMKPSAGSVSNVWLRKALVIVQFSLSALLIVATIIVYRQTKYLNDKDLGFNKEQVIYFQVRGDVEKKLETFKSELKQSPNVLSVTSGYGLPGDMFAGDGVTIPGPEGTTEHAANVFIGDHDYIKTLGMHIIAGRDFSRDMATDVREAFIINQTAVKELGYGTPEKAIGQPLWWKEWSPLDTTQPVKKGKVIGVIQDFHYKSLHEKVTASVIQIYPQVTYTVAAKLKTADIKNTIAFINSTWNKFSPGYPMDYKFIDDTYGQMYLNEEKLSTLLWIFAVVAIVVGCLGLFGLAAFSAEQRRKEIGIRKVLGANVFNIVGLLSKNFVLMVLLASLIAFPVAWWALNKWLDDFPYRVSISWWAFALALFSALAIAMITVSFQAIRAAMTNPVKSLRTE